jgi:hypothetical protein
VREPEPHAGVDAMRCSRSASGPGRENIGQ